MILLAGLVCRESETGLKHLYAFMIRIRWGFLNVFLAMFENGMLSGNQVGFLSSFPQNFELLLETVVSELGINILNYKNT